MSERRKDHPNPMMTLAPSVATTEQVRDRRRSLVRYDPRHHPGLYQRLKLMGHTHGQIAEAFDVTVKTLHDWVKMYAEMQKAGVALDDYNGQIWQRYYDAALGKLADVPFEVQERMMRFILQHRLGVDKSFFKPEGAGAAAKEKLEERANRVVRKVEDEKRRKERLHGSAGASGADGTQG